MSPLLIENIHYIVIIITIHLQLLGQVGGTLLKLSYSFFVGPNLHALKLLVGLCGGP